MRPDLGSFTFLSRKILKNHFYCRYSSTIPNPCSFLKSNHELKPEYDVVIVGGGHNGLVSAAYLQKAGLSVCVLENRHTVGGAAVTEEIIPGFKFSRASYLLSLLRPFIISDLKLKEFGLKLHMREPYSSFTPVHANRWTCQPSQYLMLSSDLKLSQAEIAKFSTKDAENYEKYGERLDKYVKAINILLDNRPPNWSSNQGYLQKLKSFRPILDALLAVKTDIPGFHEMLTAPAEKILNKWFETDILKATLATDGLVGSMSGPKCPGTGYVLLHHVMGGVTGKAGAWAYPEGGMGAVSNAIAASAAQLGASIFVNKQVTQILYTKERKGFKACGVLLFSGEEIRARKAVFSCATPEITFKRLFPSSKEVRNEVFGEEFVQAIDGIDYTSPVTKINVAVSRLPNFIAKPNSEPGIVQDQHRCSIHLNCEKMAELQMSYLMAAGRNLPSESPMIEMVIPSSMDKTLAPEGAHVCLLFTQFTPLTPNDSLWHCLDYKNKYANRVFDIVEQYAPGFKESIIGTDILSPFDLQKIFGLTGGNIFHGSMGLDQLFWLRPVSTTASWFPESPLQGLYLCGSGAHPGGGVMGLPGFLAAKALLN